MLLLQNLHAEAAEFVVQTRRYESARSFEPARSFELARSIESARRLPILALRFAR